jgi:hypothetical protein
MQIVPRWCYHWLFLVFGSYLLVQVQPRGSRATRAPPLAVSNLNSKLLVQGQPLRAQVDLWTMPRRFYRLGSQLLLIFFGRCRRSNGALLRSIGVSILWVLNYFILFFLVLQAQQRGPAAQLGFHLISSACFLGFLHSAALAFLLPPVLANFAISQALAGTGYGCVYHSLDARCAEGSHFCVDALNPSICGRATGLPPCGHSAAALSCWRGWLTASPSAASCRPLHFWTATAAASPGTSATTSACCA